VIGQVLLVRPVSGVVGERARVTHLAQAPEQVELSARLTAFCGTEFGPGELELLDGVTGMPCESCLRQASMSTREPSRLELAFPADEISARLTAIETLLIRISSQLDALWLRSRGSAQKNRFDIAR
jgi:hypothetical protein